jgi:hypothetical protein
MWKRNTDGPRPNRLFFFCFVFFGNNSIVIQSGNSCLIFWFVCLFSFFYPFCLWNWEDMWTVGNNNTPRRYKSLLLCYNHFNLYFILIFSLTWCISPFTSWSTLKIVKNCNANWLGVHNCQPIRDWRYWTLYDQIIPWSLNDPSPSASDVYSTTLPDSW